MPKNRLDYDGSTVYGEKTLLQKIWSVGIGRIFLLALASTVIILIDVLISWNNAKTFLIILGVEILIVIAASWIYFFFNLKN